MNRKRVLDPEALAREGYTSVKCGNPRCPKQEVLAHQSPDGKEVIPVNSRVGVEPNSRVGLRCPSCGKLTEWRASRGTDSRRKTARLPRT